MRDAAGIDGAAAPPAWRSGGAGLVEMFGQDDPTPALPRS